MGVSEGKIAQIEAGYKKLDDNKAKMEKSITALFKDKPELKKFADKIEVYYVLGKEDDKIMVAAKSSHFYAVNRSLAPTDDIYNPQDGAYYVHVTGEQLLWNIKNPNKISVGVAVTETGKNITVSDKTFRGVKIENFYHDPRNLATVLRATGEVIYSAAEEAGIIEAAKKAAAADQAKQTAQDAAGEVKGLVQ